MATLEDQITQVFEKFYYVTYSSEKLKNKTNDFSYPEIELKYNFPKQKEDSIIERIYPFCFPNLELYTTQNEPIKELYTFVLTDLDGSRLHSHCLLFCPNSTNKKPESLIFVSKLTQINFFTTLLGLVSLKKAFNSSHFDLFLKSIRSSAVPQLGETFKVSIPRSLSIPNDFFEYTRPNTLLGGINTKDLFTIFDSKQLICLFAALLFERRVIFTSDSLTKLTTTIYSFVGLLYPFEWAHALIPIIPSNMIHACCAPFPYIIGIHKSLLSKAEDVIEEECVYADLDTREVEMDPVDLVLLPSRLATKLMDSIKKHRKKLKASGEFDQGLILREFLNFFVSIFYDYESHFQMNETNNEFEFDFESFKKKKNKSIKRFLLAFSQTQMFESFFRNKEMQMKNQKDDTNSFFVDMVNQYKQTENNNSGSNFLKGLWKRKNSIKKQDRKEIGLDKDKDTENENENENKNEKESENENKNEKKKDDKEIEIEKGKNEKHKDNKTETTPVEETTTTTSSRNRRKNTVSEKFKGFFNRNKKSLQLEFEEVEEEEEQEEEKVEDERLLSVIQGFWSGNKNKFKESRFSKRKRKNSNTKNKPKNHKRNDDLKNIRSQASLKLIEKFENLSLQNEQRNQTLTRNSKNKNYKHSNNKYTNNKYIPRKFSQNKTQKTIKKIENNSNNNNNSTKNNKTRFNLNNQKQNIKFSKIASNLGWKSNKTEEEKQRELEKKKQKDLEKKKEMERKKQRDLERRRELERRRQNEIEKKKNKKKKRNKKKWKEKSKEILKEEENWKGEGRMD
ncbi:denn domain-containing [Anaeramoeba flamelloides]|uniref:Denn domain-containing n=1 Tax=Anaeramoeba flamelloides TaxID=1746091 RepID=A0AAV7ZGW7_9EUKA|nr:denn domain-containing [Anaeramoeba flamelloides]